MTEWIEMAQILSNPEQPRSVFDETELAALTESLEEFGLLQPVSVTGPLEGFYILNDGERRYRAAQRLGWKAIPAHVRAPENDRNGHSRVVLALIGNLQRSDMGIVDEARAFEKLRAAGVHVDDIARIIGKSTATVYNRLALLDGNLTETTLGHLNRGRLPNELNMLRALKRLNAEQQDLVVSRAIVAGSSAQSIRTAVSRMINQTPIPQRRNKRSAKHAVNGNIAPALAVNDVALGEAHADVIEAVIQICERCGLGEDKTGVICRDCPLAALMLKLAQEE